MSKRYCTACGKNVEGTDEEHLRDVHLFGATSGRRITDDDDGEYLTELRRAQGIIDRLRDYREKLLTLPHKSTPEMRHRIRELSTPARDDHDRAVVMLLDDFERAEVLIFAGDVVVSNQIYGSTEMTKAIDWRGDDESPISVNYNNDALSVISRLEKYDFSCEGGPLSDCIDFQVLKDALLTASRALGATLKEFDIAGKDPRYVGRIFVNTALTAIGRADGGDTQGDA